MRKNSASIVQDEPRRNPTTRFASSLILCAWATFTFNPSEQARASSLSEYVGCWVTPVFTPITILSDSSKEDGWQLLREKMLLEIRPIPDAENLVVSHFYVWQTNMKNVIGPVYQNGAYDPVAGTLTVGSPKGGVNIVRLVSDQKLLYIHTKAADTSDMSVRQLDKFGCAAARELEEDLRTRRQ